MINVPVLLYKHCTRKRTVEHLRCVLMWVGVLYIIYEWDCMGVLQCVCVGGGGVHCVLCTVHAYSVLCHCEIKYCMHQVLYVSHQHRTMYLSSRTIIPHAIPQPYTPRSTVPSMVYGTVKSNQRCSTSPVTFGTGQMMCCSLLSRMLSLPA